MSEPVVKVIFRYWRGDVIALFPEFSASTSQWWLCTSYMHVGQHGAADAFAIIRDSRPATRDKYAALKRELESPPYQYRFELRRRFTASMREALHDDFSRLYAPASVCAGDGGTPPSPGC